MSVAFAIKTSNVELGNNGIYDGKVKIERTTDGCLTFEDDLVTTPVNLFTLYSRINTHSELTGLGSDDHSQYLTNSRHLNVHSAVFNDSLIISPDVNNNITLGSHLTDGNIHLQKNFPETITAPWTFNDDVTINGSIFGDGSNLTGIEKKKANIISVAKSGGDFSSIQSAIDSITDVAPDKPYTILLYPGIYDEKITLKDYISLVGYDKKTCKIISNQSYNGMDARTGFVVKNTNGEVRNLYIENTRTTYPSVAIYQSGNGIIINCELRSAAQDTVYLDAGKLHGCYIYNSSTSGGTSDALSVDGSAIIENCVIESENEAGCVWIGNANCSPKFYDCTFIFPYAGNAAGVRLFDTSWTLTPHFYNCKFFYTNYTPGKFIANENYGANTTIYHSGCLYSEKGEDSCSFIEVRQGDQSVKSINANSAVIYNLGGIVGSGNSLTIGSGAVLIIEKNSSGIYFEGPSGLGAFKLLHEGTMEWCDGDGFSDTNLYRNSASELKTDSDFSCGDFECVSAKFTDNITLAEAKWLGLGSSAGRLEFENASQDSLHLKASNLLIDDGAISVLKSGNIASVDLFRTDNPASPGNIAGLYFQGYNTAAMPIKITFASIVAETTNVASGTEMGDIKLNTRNAGALNSRLTIKANGDSEFTKNRWKDWAAVSFCNMNSYNSENHQHRYYYGEPNDISTYDDSIYPKYAWHPNNSTSPTYIKCLADGISTYFPIPYEAGTILTQLRIKWQAEGNNDGVKISLAKRDESGTNTAWTTVGSQQTYTDSGSPYDVTVSVYDFSDETISENYSYSIEVQSEIASLGVRVFSFGIETSKRVF